MTVPQPYRWLAFWVALIAVCMVVFVQPATAEALRDKVNALAIGKFKARAVAIEALGKMPDPRVAPILQALGQGQLYFRKTDKQVVIANKVSGGFELADPLSLEALGKVGRRDVKKIKVNNSLRRAIRDLMGSLTLRAADPNTRLQAAESLFKSKDATAVGALDAAIAAETVDNIKQAMIAARAVSVLAGKQSEAAQIEAISVLRERGDNDARSALLGYLPQASGSAKAAAEDAVRRIEKNLAMWAAGQNIVYGLSLGSVLLLAAMGLAITFGVMGVINMAHGEMVMIGAYVTFVVQSVIKSSFPELFEWSLAIAVPAAFLVSGAVGVLIERSIIRFLYGRPLETLLATWGLSLVLQQVVRSLFGPTNQEVGTPQFMSGAFEIGQLTITYNRLYIIIFALLVLAVMMIISKRTHFGLQMRAVTQNRAMAGSMGIRTDWVDALTFGLGSGIAGIAGVALSQIDNVSPNLGQSYIIDSFMVVVFGGVGNLWGTLVGALTLGIANKFLEPFAGAVLGKILVLVFIILFIQKRPRGMFALKGRAVES
jgi:urea transport system permease protein